MIFWVWFGVAAYLLVGLVFAFKGRLAFMVDAQVAILDLAPPHSYMEKNCI